MMKDREFVADEFIERLNAMIDEDFLDFQVEVGIPTGDLHPLLDYELSLAVDALLDKINECKSWQADNALGV